MTITLHTVGYRDRTLVEFLALLQSAEIRAVVDVRLQPDATLDPHFSQSTLRESLTSAGLVYHWAGRQLGGNRQAHPHSPHRALTDSGLRGYADYMGTDVFKKAAAQLLHLGHLEPTVILCAKRDPMTCLRSLIADYLTLQGATVIHLIDETPGQTHLLRPEARRESAELVYDRGYTMAAG